MIRVLSDARQRSNLKVDVGESGLGHIPQALCRHALSQAEHESPTETL